MAPASIIAIVRPPTDALTRCQLTHIERQPIDVARACAQHEAYAAALARLGADVIVLPAEPDLPDAVFIEDIAVVLDEVAVITLPGTASRLPEIPSVSGALAAFRPLRRLQPPATLDGGDVMLMGRELLVGLSTRTNEEGVAQLADAVGPLGYTVRGVPVHGALHLKSAVTCLGGRAVLVNPAWVDADHLGARRVIEVDPDEPAAANTFRVGTALLMAAGFPRTLARLTRAGFAPVPLELSELQKAEAAGSCMSLVFRRNLAAGRAEA